MVMLKVVPRQKHPIPPVSAPAGLFLPRPVVVLITGSFSIPKYNFTGGTSLKNKQIPITDGNQLPRKKKFRFHYAKLAMAAFAFAYFFALQTDQVMAADMWSKAESIMKDVYGKILGISTIAAIVTASVALLLMNFSKSGKTVDESRTWLHRIAISWVILNGLGFILAYVTPFFADGRWNG